MANGILVNTVQATIHCTGESMNQIHTQNSLQGKTHWALWAVCLFSMVLAGFITTFKELMWMQYAREQGWLGAQFAAAQQFSFGASAVGVLLWAVLADVWGRKQALLLAWMGVVLVCGSLWLLPFRFELLRWAHMLSALALVGIPVVSVVWCWENSQRLRYGLCGLVMSGFALGMFAAHVLDYADLVAIMATHGLLVVSVACVLVVGALAVFTPQALPENVAATASQMPYAAGQLPRHDWATWFKNLLLYSAVLGLSWALTLGLRDYVGSVAMKMNPNAHMLAQVHQVLSILTAGGLALGLFVSGWVMQFLGRLTALWGLCVLVLGCMAYMTWQPNVFQDFDGAWVLVGAALGLGCLTWWSKVLVAASVAHHRCTAWALVSMGGAMMGASIHQQMRALVYGERFPFEHYAAVVVLMAILIALIRKPKVLD